jgi:CRP-like cAMP-binding protein
MYLKQSDIFWGADKEFMKRIMDISTRESHEQGGFLFHEGDRASSFYTLIKGRIRLSIGETGQTVYTVSHAGEAFGWSSLIGREVYTASAECIEPTVLMKIESEKLLKILEDDPSNGLVLFKHLAGTLGNRLLQMYSIISTSSEKDFSVSYGSGQVVDSAEYE